MAAIAETMYQSGLVLAPLFTIHAARNLENIVAGIIDRLTALLSTIDGIDSPIHW